MFLFWNIRERKRKEKKRKEKKRKEKKTIYIEFSCLIQKKKMQEENTNPIITNNTPTESIESQIRTYVIQHNPKLYILTPCYGANVFVNYMCSLIQTIDLFRQYHFPLQ